MISPRSLALAVCVAPCLAASASAQSFNISFGEPGAGPPATYAGAGLAGHWNSIRAEHTTPNPGPQGVDDFLFGLDGVLTNVRVHQFGGTALILEDDPSISGDDAALMEDALVTYSIPLKSCLYFNNLANGTYEVLSYAWTPNQPQARNRTFIDFTPGDFEVGGAWGGQHELGRTYSRHIVQVTQGFLRPHAGLPDNGDTQIGGMLNGMQIRRLTCDSCTLFCYEGASVTACPCGNGGNWGRGCDNSFSTGGGLLSATGGPSVAVDDVLLSVADLPPATVVLFFQGTTQAAGGLGTVFGDGRLCASGTILRLGARVTTAGAASYGAGDGTGALVSVRGQLPAGGGTRTYQGWYRNQQAFCTPDAFNLTNGIQIPWAP